MATDQVSVNWNDLDARLRERYQEKLSVDNPTARDILLNIKGLDWINADDAEAEAYNLTPDSKAVCY